MLHNKFLLFLLPFLATLQVLQAQTERPLPPPEAIAAVPWWAQQMYGEHPNVLQVDSAYMIWRRDNPVAKTFFTQFYKHWRRAIGGDVSPEGFWTPTSEQVKMDDFRRWEALRAEGDSRSTTWENIGPFKTYLDGTSTAASWQTNVYCLDQSLSNPLVLYAGTENGWVFKTTDGASTWTCVSNSISLTGGVGAVKVHPTDPTIAYFGQGNYVYKTTDGGSTWSIMLTYSSLNAYDISINPTTPDIVLVAGQGGLHRSINGGSSWTQLYTQKCWDIEIKTDDPTTYFLLKTNTTDDLCEFYKSTDSGATWTEKTSGWLDPSACGSTTDNDDGGARLAVTNANSGRIYALLLGDCNDGQNDNNYLGVYRSDDAGETWTLPNSNASGGPGAPYASTPDDHACLATFWFNSTQQYPTTYQYEQGIYNVGFDVSDTDADDFLVGFLNLFKSEDGGNTFTRWGGYGGGPGNQHPDIQDIDINGSEVWVSSDGGINKYSSDFSSHTAVSEGLAGSDYWGFDGGWNEDILTGGRYHNGNAATIYGTYPNGEFIRLGGGEATTGFVHPAGGRKVMHSDLGGDILPTTVSGSLGSFTFSTYPNEGYAGNNENSSEIEPDPRCYNYLFMGDDNLLLKSTDGGTTWTTLYTFGSDATKIITGIEISRSNPDVIYCIQNLTPAVLWKSTDGGSTFTQATSPSGSQNGAFISLSPTDENTIWLAWSVGSTNANKVFKSTNGGSSWTNLTTSTLDGHSVEQLQHIGGTGDGIYLATNLGVFYHDGSSWQTCSSGLPTKAAICRLVPYYAKSKVRVATYGRGIWQSDFAESFTPVVQPTVDKLTASCSRDTFHFDDYSMVDHTTASWSWSFSPTPDYVSSTSVRDPDVVFGAGGTYTATLTLNGSYSKDLTVTVSTDCDVQHYPGNSVSLDGTGDYALPSGNTNLNSNTVTITAWIKRDGAQTDWAGIAFARGGTTTTGLSIRSSDHRLAYHWNDTGYSWNSGLIVPDNTWTHVALVVTASNVKIYMNGVAATNTVSNSTEAFDTPLQIGYDNSSRYFKGQIEEVTLWNVALTQDQIRDLMNMTIDPASYPNLVSYYQFNESSGQVLDKVGTRHATLIGNASRTTSTAPVGGGISARQTVSAAGTYTWGTTGVSMQFPTGGTFPNGELSVSRINLDPDQVPNASPNNDVYWVVRNYGSNSTFTELDYLQFGDYSVTVGDEASQYKLYKRSSTAEGATWGAYIDSGDEITTGASGSVKFSTGNSNTSFSQFTVVKESALPVEWLDFKAALQADKTVRLYWTVNLAPGVSHFVVERSADGIDFQPLGEIPILAQSGTENYEHLDLFPRRGVNFYRLRQVDGDGKATYSPVRQVTVEALASEWVVFPNPISKNQMLEIQTGEVGEYRFRLYDAKGKVSFEEKLPGGDAALKLPVLAQGAYLYEIISGKRRVRGKLVVQE